MSAIDSPSPILDADLPVALRPEPRFGPLRGSIFEDPGDEKSWHASQRSESLSEFYKGRDHSWYASAVAPLRGANRVLDLGCGPGLALEALREQGASSVVGVDRWPAFAARSTPEMPIIAHDLTLPMPFLASGSFDGVFSHYVLYYMSPIGVRQVLREANRVLTPGGRLLLYVAATGLAGGDETRTVPYSAEVMTRLLEEANFSGIDVDTSPNGKNVVALAGRSSENVSDPPKVGVPQARVEGDTQLSASFEGSRGRRLTLELDGPNRSASLVFDTASSVASDSHLSICVHVTPFEGAGVALQVWIWNGLELTASESVHFEFSVSKLKVHCAGRVEHSSVWVPEDLSLEPIGNPYARLDRVRPGGALDEVEFASEGRQVILEGAEEGAASAHQHLGSGRNRFLVRPASLADASTLDGDWRSGRVHGVAVDAEEMRADHRIRDLLLWAGWRRALIYLRGSAWDDILTAASRPELSLGSSIVLVDPAMDDAEAARPLPPEVAKFTAEARRFLVLLGAPSAARSAAESLDLLGNRLLIGGPLSPDKEDMALQANESLRYVTERVLLMRLRQIHGRSSAEVGRKPVFQ